MGLQRGRKGDRRKKRGNKTHEGEKGDETKKKITNEGKEKDE